MVLVDLTGQHFGKLTVVGLAASKGWKRRWRCLCECGKETAVPTSKLTSGHTVSCGCRGAQAGGERTRTHGYTGTSIYRIWTLMIQRCENPRNPAYLHYGGRGITIDPAWRGSFEAFLADVGERPSPQHSLDRIDNDGNYGPDNVRWATGRIQSNNTRRNRNITVLGESHTLIEWERITGVNRRTIANRIDVQKWSAERALFQPTRL